MLTPLVSSVVCLISKGSLGFLLPFEYEDIYESVDRLLTEDVQLTLRMVSQSTSTHSYTAEFAKVAMFGCSKQFTTQVQAHLCTEGVRPFHVSDRLCLALLLTRPFLTSDNPFVSVVCSSASVVSHHPERHRGHEPGRDE